MMALTLAGVFLMLALPVSCDQSSFLAKEVKALEQLPSNCKTLKRKWIFRPAIPSAQAASDELLACCLSETQKQPTSSTSWLRLSTVYLYRGNQASADLCVQEAQSLLGTRQPPLVPSWWWLGPFPIGKGEIDGQPWLEGNDLTDTFYSEVLPLGKVAWQRLPSSDGTLVIQPQLDWNTLVRTTGSFGITEWQGLLRGEFSTSKTSANYIVQCIGVVSFDIDGQVFAGDPYLRQDFWHPVVLKAGAHVITLRARAANHFQAKCSIHIAGKTVKVMAPSVLPDLLDGVLVSGEMALKVMNLSPTRWLKEIKVDALRRQWKVVHENLNVAPGQSLLLPLQVRRAESPDGSTPLSPLACPTTLTLRVSGEGMEQFRLPIKLRCRKRYGESFIFTFVDHDGSVQHAAAIPPRSRCASKECGILLSFHGTGVPAQNQADAYKYEKLGMMIFGMDRKWILAPDRHGAHNWEGPGRLTASSAIAALAQLSRMEIFCEADSCPYVANTQDLAVCGHSMGGHGAWHYATLSPDNVRILVPMAGWLSKEEYGDSNLLFRHDIGRSYTDASLKAIMEATVLENQVDQLASNLKGIPIFARTGANDLTVHSFYQRKMQRVLGASGHNIETEEVPEMEHWWWSTVKDNDGGVMYDKKVRAYIEEHGSSASEMTLPETFRITLYNPASFAGRGGVVVLQLQVPFRKSTIDVHLNSETNSAVLTTANVRRFQLKRQPLLSWDWSWKGVTVDGTEFSSRSLSDSFNPTAHFFRPCPGCSWERVTDGVPDDERDQVTYGPMRRVAEAPFRIVSQHESLAALLANIFTITSDTSAPVALSQDLSTNVADTNNLILLGSPSRDPRIKELLNASPIMDVTFRDNGFNISGCSYTDPDDAIVFLTSHAPGKLSLVIAGNTLKALESALSIAFPTIPPMARSPFSNLLPDYLITGKDFLSKGTGGIQCGGFWGNKWEYRSDLSSCFC